MKRFFLIVALVVGSFVASQEASGASNLASSAGAPTIIGASTSGGTKTGFSLSSDATFSGSTLSAGHAIGWRFIAPTTTTVTDVVFYVHTAPGSGHNLTCFIAAYGAAATRPGAYLTNGIISTVDGGTTSDKWVKATFATPPNITVGVPYWVVVCDENYDAGNIYQIMSRPTAAPTNQVASSLILCASSTDGFTTNGTIVASPASIAIAFGDGSYLGQPFTARTTSASSQVYRGVKFTPEEDITIGGLLWASSAAMGTSGTMAVYADGAAAVFAGFNGGAAFTIPADANTLAFTFRCPAFTLVGGTTYRIIVKPGANDTDPNYYEIGDVATHATILQGCSITSDGKFVWTLHDGGGDLSTGWTDTASAIPAFGLLVTRTPPVAGGGQTSYSR